MRGRVVRVGVVFSVMAVAAGRREPAWVDAGHVAMSSRLLMTDGRRHS